MKTKKILPYLLGAALCAVPQMSQAAPGDLDTTFSSDGKVTTSFSNSDSGGTVQVQSDGKLVLVGTTSGASDADIAIARYNSDGSLDTSFSGDGKLTVDLGGDDYVGHFAIQSDGKYVIGGTKNVDTGTSTTDETYAIRLNTSGTFDTTFSGDGKVFLDLVTDEWLSDFAVAASGKILLGTQYSGDYNPSGQTFYISQLNSDGTLDTTFSGDGKVATAVGGGNWGGLADVAVQADGKVLAYGEAGSAWTENDLVVVRYNSNGTLDTTFAGDGIWTHDVYGNTNNDIGSAMRLSGGKILLTGRTFALIRLNSDGTMDTSFDGDGLVTAGPGWDYNGMAVQPDGRIILIATGPPTTFGVVRFNSTGTLNLAFSSANTGYVTTEFGVLETPVSVTVQSDGKIVVGGSFGTPGVDAQFAIARYVGNPITPSLTTAKGFSGNFN